MKTNDLSKAELARLLVAKGVKKSVHTLRKLPVGTLHAMLAETVPTQESKPVQETIPEAVAIPQPVCVAVVAPPMAVPTPAQAPAIVRQHHRPASWAALAWQPFAFVFALLRL
jgi:hypothetical protein